jgi:hypothetical protein
MRRSISIAFVAFGLCLAQTYGCAQGTNDTDSFSGSQDASVDAKDSSHDSSPDSGTADSTADTQPQTDSSTDTTSSDAGPDGQDSSSDDSSIADSTPTDSTPVDSAQDSTVDSHTDSPVDAGPLSAIHISEIYVAMSMQGDLHEWIEIAGPAGSALDDLMVRHYRWNSDADPTVLQFDLPLADGGKTMPSSGLWVAGGVMADYTDQSWSIASPSNFGFDGTAGSIQLYLASTGELLDAVGYGTAQPAQAPNVPYTTMYGSPAPLPSSGTSSESTGRIEGSKSGDNSKDFCVQAATPGKPNAPCE